MKRLFVVGAVAAYLTGCSLISDFGSIDYDDTVQGQDSGAGTADGGGGAGGTDSGAGGAGGDAGPDSGTDGGPDTGAPFMCMNDDDAGCTDCVSDVDCRAGVCESGLCVACRADGDCGADEVCVLNTCTPDRKPSSVWFSAGGGPTTSTNLRARISIGAPQPMGRASSSALNIVIGPGAGFPQ